MRVVETGFEHAVVHRDYRERQLAGVLHGLERPDAAGGLLGDADDIRHQLGPFHRGEAGEARSIIDDDVRLELVEQVQSALMRLHRRPIRIVGHGNAFRAKLLGHALVVRLRAAIRADLRARGFELT